MTNKDKIDFSNYVYQPTYLYSEASQHPVYTYSQPPSYTSRQPTQISSQPIHTYRQPTQISGQPIYTDKTIKKKKYHGPVINNDNQPTKQIIVTKKYYNSREKKYIETTKKYAYDPEYHKMLNLNPIPLNFSRNEMNSYFREKERILKNKHMDEILRLEAQKVYTNISRF